MHNQKRLNAKQQVIALRVAIIGLKERHALATGTYRDSLEQKIVDWQEMEAKAMESYIFQWSADTLVEQKRIKHWQHNIDQSPTPNIDFETNLMEAQVAFRELLREATELNGKEPTLPAESAIPPLIMGVPQAGDSKKVTQEQ